eukprot:PhM_4_TR17058/c0_g1_i1/m.90343
MATRRRSLSQPEKGAGHQQQQQQRQQQQSALSLDDITRIYSRYSTARNLDASHTPRNLSLSLLSDVGEVCEMFQWRPEATTDGVLEWSQAERGILAERLSQLLLTTVRLSEQCGIDLTSAVVAHQEKLARLSPGHAVSGNNNNNARTDQSSPSYSVATVSMLGTPHTPAHGGAFHTTTSSSAAGNNNANNNNMSSEPSSAAVAPLSPARLSDENFWEYVQLIEAVNTPSGEPMTAEAFDALGVKFVIQYNGDRIPLIPNGESIAVSLIMKDTYTRLVREKKRDLDNGSLSKLSLERSDRARRSVKSIMSHQAQPTQSVQGTSTETSTGAVAVENTPPVVQRRNLKKSDSIRVLDADIPNPRFDPGHVEKLYSPQHFAHNIFSPHTTQTRFQVDTSDEGLERMLPVSVSQQNLYTGATVNAATAGAPHNNNEGMGNHRNSNTAAGAMAAVPSGGTTSADSPVLMKSNNTHIPDFSLSGMHTVRGASPQASSGSEQGVQLRQQEQSTTALSSTHTAAPAPCMGGSQGSIPTPTTAAMPPRIEISRSTTNSNRQTSASASPQQNATGGHEAEALSPRSLEQFWEYLDVLEHMEVTEDFDAMKIPFSMPYKGNIVQLGDHHDTITNANKQEFVHLARKKLAELIAQDEMAAAAVDQQQHSPMSTRCPVSASPPPGVDVMSPSRERRDREQQQQRSTHLSAGETALSPASADDVGTTRRRPPLIRALTVQLPNVSWDPAKEMRSFSPSHFKVDLFSPFTTKTSFLDTNLVPRLALLPEDASSRRSTPAKDDNNNAGCQHSHSYSQVPAPTLLSDLFHRVDEAASNVSNLTANSSLNNNTNGLLDSSGSGSGLAIPNPVTSILHLTDFPRILDDLAVLNTSDGERCTEESFAEFHLTFCIPHKTKLVELVEDGRRIPVTLESLPRYLELARAKYQEIARAENEKNANINNNNNNTSNRKSSPQQQPPTTMATSSTPLHDARNEQCSEPSTPL